MEDLNRVCTLRIGNNASLSLMISSISYESIVVDLDALMAEGFKFNLMTVEFDLLDFASSRVEDHQVTYSRAIHGFSTKDSDFSIIDRLCDKFLSTCHSWKKDQLPALRSRHRCIGLN